jgi:hypothetical protein
LRLYNGCSETGERADNKGFLNRVWMSDRVEVRQET